jgi:hypothetical protein
MILGNYVKCSGCGHEYRIRYNVGNNFPQTASFFCKDCGETITYGFDVDHKLICENAEIATSLDGVDVINLHPELSIDDTRQSAQNIFLRLIF